MGGTMARGAKGRRMPFGRDPAATRWRHPTGGRLASRAEPRGSWGSTEAPISADRNGGRFAAVNWAQCPIYSKAWGCTGARSGPLPRLRVLPAHLAISKENCVTRMEGCLGLFQFVCIGCVN